MSLFSLTVAPGDVAATLTDYPAYVDLSQMPASFWATVSEDAQTHSLDLERSSSQYASISHASQTGLALTGSFTIELWIKIETFGVEMGLVDKMKWSSTRNGYTLSIDPGGVLQSLIYDNSGNLSRYSSSGVFTSADVGNWVYIAIEWNSAAPGSMRMYKGGKPLTVSTANSSASSVGNTNTQEFAIGRYNATNYADCLIKDVRVFKDSRTESEINADMYTKNVVDANLVGEWNFNNVYTDSSGNGNTLTPINSPVFSTAPRPFSTSGGDIRCYSDEAMTTELAREVVSCDTATETGELHVKIPSLTTTTVIYIDVDGLRSDYTVIDTYGRNAVWSEYGLVYHNGTNIDSTGNNGAGVLTGSPTIGGVTGDIGEATDLNGTSQYITYSDNVSLRVSTGLTTQFRVKFDVAPTSNKTIISNGNYDPGQYDHWAESSKFRGYSLINGTPRLIDATTSLTTGVWYSSVYTYDGTTQAIYTNGVQEATASHSGTVSGTNRGVRIGARHGASGSLYLNGQIDEVRIRATALSQNWVTTEENNQSDPAGFWTIAEVGAGGTSTQGLMMMM